MLIALIFTFLLEGFFFHSGFSQNPDNVSVYTSLRKKLLTGYDPTIKPVKNYEQPVNVSTLVILKRLISVDMSKSTVTFELYTLMDWIDEFLVWNPDDYQGIDHINLPPEIIWKPVISEVSSSNYNEQDNLDLTVRANGLVFWIKSSTVSLKCQMDLTNYPFDEQSCNFLLFTKFSWPREIKLMPYLEGENPAMNMAQALNPEWTVTIDRNFLTNTTGTSNITKQYIYVSMTLARKTSSYQYILVIPYLASNLLIFYAFMLPQSSGRRIFLGSLALFVDFALMSLISYELGFDSNQNAPYAVKCLSINLLMVGIFIIISVFGSRYIAKSSSQAPSWVQGLVKNGLVNKFLAIHISSKELADIDSEMAKLNTGSTELDNQQQQSNDWLSFTVFLDRLYLIIFTILFIFYHS